MKVNVQVFGQLTDITHCKTLEINDVPDTNAALQKIYEKFPALKGLNFIIALDNDIVHDNTELSSDSSITLMPPFSGG